MVSTTRSKINSRRKAPRGVTLIMVAGVLTLLSALAAGFYTMAVIQNRVALNYADSSRAILMAQAGMADAIARIHETAYLKTEDPGDPWVHSELLRQHVNAQFFRGDR